jgi:hypothetical protein
MLSKDKYFITYIIIRGFQYIAQDFWEELTDRYASSHLQSDTTNNYGQVMLAGSRSLYLSDIETSTIEKIQLHGNWRPSSFVVRCHHENFS